MYKRSFKDYFSRNRKALYMILGILLVSTLSLTIVYAALSVTLNIVGTAEVSSASWDVHLDNVKVTSGSVSGDTPTISGGTTATFSTKLEVPGDFYEFTIDVVNNGNIDAMIESVTKTPTLTARQSTYLKYEVEYQNGETINTRQLVKKDSFVRLKIRVEFRKDITASVLPDTSETLNLAFTVNYVQSDNTGTDVIDGGVTKAKVVNGDINTVGSEICIQEECFYVISSDTDTVTMLAKYNLNVGYIINNLDVQEVPPGSSHWVKTEEKNLITATVKQDSSALGNLYNNQTYEYNYPYIGVTAFSNETKKGANYWDYKGSIVEGYVNDYDEYLSRLGVTIDEARLIGLGELYGLGCEPYDPEKWGGSCENAPDWVTSTTYWTGTPEATDSIDYESWYDPYLEKDGYPDKSFVYVIKSYEPALDFSYSEYYFWYGVRPVIVVSKSNF